ncbi:hypothetical protein [Streptomyces heilongjiangensis]|uniref:Uncharacterized protein n=1 Tax=Streptomyces heilongjiangensis TaxID=945052 RepID=A0ABW1BHQ7_9ACTN|nr:hypothetical protein [Streptomyces heilongjiangensis]MDC2951046.1 hypothetical protein [Streptomyces heilongjiangensis]
MTARRTLGTGPAALAPVAAPAAAPVRLLPVERAAVEEDQEDGGADVLPGPEAGRKRRPLRIRGE